MKINKFRYLLFAFLFLFPLMIFSQNAENEKLKLAQSYEKGGSFQDAARLYLDLYELHPNNDDYFLGYIRANKALNKYSDLIPFLEKHLETNQSVANYTLLGEMQWRAGKTVEANVSWEKALELAPNIMDTYQEIGNSLIVLRQFEKAINIFLKGRKVLKSDNLYADALSQLYISIGDFKNGINEVFNQFEISKNLAMVQGRITALKQKQNLEAAKYIEQVLRKRAVSGNIAYLQILAWYLRTIDNFEEAFAFYKQIDEELKTQGQEVYNFAVSSMQDGHYDIAIKAYNYVVDKGKSSPFSIKALFGLARSLEYKIEKDPKINSILIDDIIKRYRNIIKENPNTQYVDDCKLRIANLQLNQLNDNEAAITVLNDLLETTKNPKIASSASNLLADIYIITDRLDDADKIYKQVVTKYKKSVPEEYYDALFGIAEIEYYKGDADSALTHFTDLSMFSKTNVANDALEKVTIIEPNKGMVKALNLFAKAELKDRQKKSDEASKLFFEASQAADGTELAEMALMKAAKIENQLNRRANERVYLQKILDSNPETIYGDYSLYHIGKSYFEENNYELALTKFNELLSKFPRSIHSDDTRDKIRIIRAKPKS